MVGAWAATSAMPVAIRVIENFMVNRSYVMLSQDAR